MATEQFLTVQDVASRVGKSVRTVHRAIDAGKLTPVMRVGTGDNAPYLFTAGEVARWMADRTQQESA